MNIFKLIDELEKVDGDVFERLGSRRSTLSNVGKFGMKTALAAVPLALGSMFRKSYGQSTNSILDVLNFALTLEYLEYEFYDTGLKSAGLIPAGAATQAMELIRRHENAHINFLKTAITASGGTPVDKPTFDFTANNTFADVFTNYQTFLALSQAFEDTGVRAYKGQAANLISNNEVLQAALQIHSVEARHAAHVRRMRMEKGWITNDSRGTLPQAAQAVYNGEGNMTQGGVNLETTFAGKYTKEAISEAFDEPLTKEQTLEIASLFIA